MELGLTGRNALVTGGSKGVGRAVVFALAREGANVAICYRTDSATPDLVARCGEFGVRAVALQADLATDSAAEELVTRAEEKLGPLDVLVNNAGVWPTNSVLETPLDEWQRTINVNLTAPFLTSKAFVASALAANRPARVLNVSSQAAFNGSTTGHAHYAASKAALNNFTLSFARELRGTGITINAVTLGMVETEMVKDALESNREYYEKRTIIGRVATPEEIADIMVFLVSDVASYLTGSVFDATGGMITR